MRIEMDEGGDVDDFVAVEEGDYRVRVGGVLEKRRPESGVAWMLRMELVDGERAGRTAVTDWLNFNPRGMRRVRMVLAALGFDVSESLEVEPTDLVGRQAMVRVTVQESQHAVTLRVQRRNRVPYDGWSPVGGDEPSSGSPPSGAGSSGGSYAADEMPF